MAMWPSPLRPGLFQLVENQLFGLCSYLVGKDIAVGQNISEFLFDASYVCFIGPLEALEKFRGFDADALREVRGCVKLRPVALRDESAKRVSRRLVPHTQTLQPPKDIEPSRYP
jgi:hypothetical protein